jgi:hypothetical protein
MNILEQVTLEQLELERIENPDPERAYCPMGECEKIGDYKRCHDRNYIKCPIYTQMLLMKL